MMAGRTLAASVALVLLSLSRVSGAAQAAFYPNVNITDTSGNLIQAHSGAIIQDQNALKQGNNVWYWFGQNDTTDTDGDYFRGVTCYKTNDFTSWDYLGLALEPMANTNISTSAVVERPKVLYNKKNDEYVMWFHSDNHDYSLAEVGIATSKTITGPYKYGRSFSPLGHQSRDMTVWQDPTTDEGYLIFATDNNANLAIASLNDEYTNATKVLYNFTDVYWEAPGVIKRQDTFYLLYSPQDGWTPDDNGWMKAPAMKGPWTKPKQLAPKPSDTYLTQNGYDITIKGTKNTTYMYLGDRWNGVELFSSGYAFMPLVFGDDTLRIHNTGGWSLNAETGEWSDLDFDAIHAANTNSTQLVSCASTCAGGKAANMTNSTGFEFEWTGAAGDFVVQIQYSYDGAANAFSQIAANVDQVPAKGYALLESSQDNYKQQAAIPLKLKKGSTTTMNLVQWDGSEVLIEGVRVYELMSGSSVASP